MGCLTGQVRVSEASPSSLRCFAQGEESWAGECQAVPEPRSRGRTAQDALLVWACWLVGVLSLFSSSFSCFCFCEKQIIIRKHISESWSGRRQKLGDVEEQLTAARAPLSGVVRVLGRSRSRVAFGHSSLIPYYRWTNAVWDPHSVPGQNKFEWLFSVYKSKVPAQPGSWARQQQDAWWDVAVPPSPTVFRAGCCLCCIDA